LGKVTSFINRKKRGNNRQKKRQPNLGMDLPTGENGRAKTGGNIVGDMATGQLGLEQACVELRHS
jgi:hypothetical protein